MRIEIGLAIKEDLLIMVSKEAHYESSKERAVSKVI
jgi:hypothetical protein